MFIGIMKKMDNLNYHFGAICYNETLKLRLLIHGADFLFSRCRITKYWTENGFIFIPILLRANTHEHA